jgi:hypothetical protein
MRQRILAILAALVSLCLFVKLSSPQLQNTRLAWLNWDSLTGRNNFYFTKRQWLADARTIVAAVRYLCESRTANQINPVDVAHSPHLPPARQAISTNLFGIDATVSSPPLTGSGMSSSERLIGRNRLASLNELPPMFAFAESSANRFY